MSEVAALSGLTVRALHHYDAIGLLVPSRRSASGYRLYTDEDFLRLQQVLIGRELGLPLEAIRRSLDDPAFDRKRTLLTQRAELARRAHATARMIASIDAALAAIDEPGSTEDATMDMKKLFDGFDPDQYADEARERWGSTEAYKVSMQRTKSYKDTDWIQLRDEQAAIYAALAELLKNGAAPDSREAMDAADQHRLSIDRWFYPCGPAMHCGLADLYEADRRFAENIDKHGAGLTEFLAAAIRANAQRTAR